MKTVTVYGSMTGSTEGVAEDLAQAFDAATVSAGDADAAALEGCELLILGASTWGMGDLQDDMAEFISNFSSMDVSIPQGAVSGWVISSDTVIPLWTASLTWLTHWVPKASSVSATGRSRAMSFPVPGHRLMTNLWDWCWTRTMNPTKQRIVFPPGLSR